MKKLEKVMLDANLVKAYREAAVRNGVTLRGLIETAMSAYALWCNEQKAQQREPRKDDTET